MFLSILLINTINEKWEESLDNEKTYLKIVYIHPSLAKSIEVEGDEVPTVFNPNDFNSIEDRKHPDIIIEVSEQDILINYVYVNREVN